MISRSFANVGPIFCQYWAKDEPAFRQRLVEDERTFCLLQILGQGRDGGQRMLGQCRLSILVKYFYQHGTNNGVLAGYDSKHKYKTYQFSEVKYFASLRDI